VTRRAETLLLRTTPEPAVFCRTQKRTAHPEKLWERSVEVLVYTHVLIHSKRLCVFVFSIVFRKGVHLWNRSMNRCSTSCVGHERYYYDRNRRCYLYLCMFPRASMPHSVVFETESHPSTSVCTCAHSYYIHGMSVLWAGNRSCCQQIKGNVHVPPAVAKRHAMYGSAQYRRASERGDEQACPRRRCSREL
jgi:hypothetical protein